MSKYVPYNPIVDSILAEIMTTKSKGVAIAIFYDPRGNRIDEHRFPDATLEAAATSCAAEHPGCIVIRVFRPVVFKAKQPDGL